MRDDCTGIDGSKRQEGLGARIYTTTTATIIRILLLLLLLLLLKEQILLRIHASIACRLTAALLPCYHPSTGLESCGERNGAPSPS
eukprot:COSAG05_NODE_274_length_12437_cov_130.209353_6_plen_86_part_00